MPIDKLDNFADSASAVVQEPTPTEKGLGWKEAEQVVAGHHNWLQKGQNDTINRIIDERFNTTYNRAASPGKMLTTGVWDEDWASTISTLNYISQGSTKKYVDVKPYFTSDGDPRLLLLDQSTNKVEIWDPRGDLSSNEDISQDLAADLDATGDTRHAVSMCTDGTYVFVAFYNQTQSGFDIGCWNISTWVKLWGPSVTSDTIGVETSRNFDIIIASDTFIATISSNVNVTGATSPCLTTFNRSTGVKGTEGAGDLGITVTGTRSANASMVSDGTNLYFTATETTSQWVCSALITNVQSAGSGLSNYPHETTNRSRSVIGTCGNLMISAYSKSSAWVASDVCIKAHASDADLDYITIGQNTDATPDIGDDYLFYNPTHITFDGLSFWLISSYNSAFAYGGNFLLKIDASKFVIGTGGSSLTRNIDDLHPSVFMIPQNADFGANSYKFQRCVFDGRDIWINPEWQASATFSGRVYRLALATLRS